MFSAQTLLALLAVARVLWLVIVTVSVIHVCVWFDSLVRVLLGCAITAVYTVVDDAAARYKCTLMRRLLYVEMRNIQDLHALIDELLREFRAASRHTLHGPFAVPADMSSTALAA